MAGTGGSDRQWSEAGGDELAATQLKRLVLVHASQLLWRRAQHVLVGGDDGHHSKGGGT